MATNYTTNYQLNQWEPTDQVLRTDFNADNAKLDAALGVKLGAAELIGETTLGGFAFSVTLDLTGVDWNQWSIVAFLVEPRGSNADNYSFHLQGITTDSLSELSGEISPLVGPRMIVAFPLRNQNREVHCLTFPGGQLTLSQDVYGDIQSVSAGTNNAYGLAVGSRIRAWGIR